VTLVAPDGPHPRRGAGSRILDRDAEHALTARSPESLSYGLVTPNAELRRTRLLSASGRAPVVGDRRLRGPWAGPLRSGHNVEAVDCAAGGVACGIGDCWRYERTVGRANPPSGGATLGPGVPQGAARAAARACS
jgi:hypothetical protein